MSKQKSGQPPVRANSKGGRKGKYDDWLTPDGLLKIQGWARNGLTDEQIAHNCGISLSTLKIWKDRFPAILTALKQGKEVVDLMVENALLKRALGYTYEEITRERVKAGEDADGVPVYEMEETKRVTKEVIPDTTAQIYWLKNRRRDIWKDNHDRAEVDRERLEIEKARLELEAEEAGAPKTVTLVLADELQELAR